MHPCTAHSSPMVITATFLLFQGRNQLAVKADSDNWICHKPATFVGHQSQSSIIRTTNYDRMQAAYNRMQSAYDCMQTAYDGKIQAACIHSGAPA